MLVRAYRWNRLQRLLDITSSYAYSIYLYAIGQMGFLTPGKIGEFIKALYLSSNGFSLSDSTVSVIGDRLFDVFTVSIMALTAGIYFFPEVATRSTTLFVLGFMLVLGLAIFFLFGSKIAYLIRKLFERLLPSWLQTKASSLLESLQKLLHRTPLRESFFLLGISLTAFVLQTIRLQFLAQSLEINVSFLPLLGITAIMSLSNMLPISFLGLGTRDAVFLYFFGLLGVAPVRSVGLSFTVLLSILVNVSFGSLLFIVNPPAFDVSEYIASAQNTSNTG